MVTMKFDAIFLFTPSFISSIFSCYAFLICLSVVSFYNQNYVFKHTRTYMPLTLYPRRGSRDISDVPSRHQRVSAINPLVAFYDIREGKREVLFFYFVPNTTREKYAMLYKHFLQTLLWDKLHLRCLARRRQVFMKILIWPDGNVI
jgi:hypothetical protein